MKKATNSSKQINEAPIIIDNDTISQHELIQESLIHFCIKLSTLIGYLTSPHALVIFTARTASTTYTYKFDR